MVVVNTNLNRRSIKGAFFGRPTIDGQGQPRVLRKFLLSDAQSQVFKRTYPVMNRSIRLNLIMPDGKPMRDICGLNQGINEMTVGIREEAYGRNGHKRKVLYGWDNPLDWGILARAQISYIVSQKNGTEEWEPLSRPIPLKGLNGMQQAKREGIKTVEAVTNGLGKRIAGRFWHVSQDAKGACVYYTYVGKMISIFGFDGHDKVYSLIFESEDKIIAQFYKDKKDAKARENLIKTVVLSERGTIDGKKSSWVPLKSPEVIFATENSALQRSRALTSQLRAFLLSDQEEGATFALEPHKVSCRRIDLTIKVTREEDHNGVAIIPGFGKFDGKTLFGKIVAQRGKKTVYFWEDKAAMGGAPPIFPDGYVIAKKTDNWDIVWRATKDAWRREKLDKTKRYGNYLFCNAGSRTREITWNTYRSNGDWGVRTRAYRNIRGVAIIFEMPLNSPVSNDVFSVTREIAGCVKLIEFWLNERDYREEKKPLCAYFIVIKTKWGEWGFFQSRVDNVEKLKAATREVKGVISGKQLDDIFCDDYLILRHETETFRISKAFKFSG